LALVSSSCPQTPEQGQANVVAASSIFFITSECTKKISRICRPTYH